MEEYEQQRGKGSFPAHITPGYQAVKKANEMASKVSAHTTCMLVTQSLTYINS